LYYERIWKRIIPETTRVHWFGYYIFSLYFLFLIYLISFQRLSEIISYDIYIYYFFFNSNGEANVVVLILLVCSSFWFIYVFFFPFDRISFTSHFFIASYIKLIVELFHHLFYWLTSVWWCFYIDVSLAKYFKIP
jgi:hypothetical protein